MIGAGSFSVLLREVVRTSRRWRTYALRAGWAAILVVLLMGTYQALEGADVAELSTLGRERFIGFAVFQMVLVGLVAPVLVGQGIIEERLDGTLELVAITRLTPGRILIGKLLSRLLVIFLIVMGSFPILALQLQFGGVSAGEFLGAASGTVVAVVVMALVGLVVSLFSRGVIAPAIAGLVFAVPAFIIVPAIASTVTGRDFERMAMWSPVAFSASKETWYPAVVPLVWLPTIVGLLTLAIVAFRVKLTEGDRADDDRDLLQWDRLTYAASALMTLAFLSSPLPAVYQYAWDLQQSGTLQLPAQLAGVALPESWMPTSAWVALALLAATSFYVQLVGRLLDRVDGLLGSGLRSAQLPGWRRLRSALLVEPILWREALTRGAGAVTWLSAAATVGFLVLLVLVGCAGALDEGEVRLLLGILAVALATGGGALLASTTVGEERRAQTFELLLLTTLRPWRVAFGKVVVAYAQVAPLALLGGLLIGSFSDPNRWENFHDHGLFGGAIFEHLWLPRVVAFGGWALVWAFAVVAISLVFAMRLRPPQIQLPIVLVGPWSVPLAAIVTEVVGNAGHPRALATTLRGVLVPFVADTVFCPYGGVPPEVVVATLGWGSLGLVAFVVFAARLRPWVQTDRPG